MRRHLIATLSVALLALTLNAAWLAAQAPHKQLRAQTAVGTGFTYQGRLELAGSSVNDTCDFQYSLWNAASGGTQLGNPVTATGVTVDDGYFTVQLDFGDGVFTGEARWLAIAVRCPAGAGSYTTLSPRQALTAAPYALALPGLWTQANASSPNVIGGSSDNRVLGGVVGATIGGGGSSDSSPGSTNRVTDDYGTVGGGLGNRAGDAAGSADDAFAATVAGGSGNVASGLGATVGGGTNNEATDYEATVGGGFFNDAIAFRATVGGGAGNEASGRFATVAGGGGNTASGDNATVSGGFNNLADGNHTTVGGGGLNAASAEAATVAGGLVNVASGEFAAVPGGRNNSAGGNFSFAAGRRATIDAAHDGAFLFADAGDFDFNSAAANEFAVRATGGTRFVLAVDGSGNPTWTCTVVNGGSWSCSSDRHLKENLSAVDERAILEDLSRLPIFTWNAKSQDPAVRHIGPMAQDFYAAFGVGEDDRHISTIDLDGVALAAIQGLYQLNQERAAQITALQTQNAELEARLSALEAALGSNGTGWQPAWGGWGQPGLLFVGALLLGLVAIGRRRTGGER